MAGSWRAQRGGREALFTCRSREEGGGRKKKKKEGRKKRKKKEKRKWRKKRENRKKIGKIRKKLLKNPRKLWELIWGMRSMPKSEKLYKDAF